MLLLTALLALTQANPLVAGRTFDVPSAGHFDYMAVDNKYRRVLAAHTGPGKLTVLDLNTSQVSEIETGGINGVQVNSKFDKVFLAGAGQKLIALDRKTLQKTGEVATDGPGDDLVVDNKTGEIYVCHDDGTEDWVFDAKTLKLVGSVTVAGAPEYVLYDETTDKLYQNIKPTNQLQVIDPATKKVVANWDTAPMTSPHGLAIDRRSGRAFSAGRNGKMVVFDIKTGKIVSTVDIATGTDQIAWDGRLKRVYCACSGFISVVQETEDGGATLLGNVKSPAGAHTIAVDPTTHNVYVCYGDEKSGHLAEFTVGK